MINRNRFPQFFLAIIIMLLGSCNNNKNAPIVTEIIPQKQGDFNLWLQVGESPNYARYIINLTSLDEGVLKLDKKSDEDISSKIPYGVIQKDKHYYTVSKDGKFGKYHVSNDHLIIDKEIRFTEFYNNFCHVWEDEQTLVLFGPDKDKSSIKYARIDVSAMEITKGTIPLPDIPKGFNQILIANAQITPDHIFLGFKYFNSEASTYQSGMKIAVLNSNTLDFEKEINDSRTGTFGRIGIYGFHQGYGDLYQIRTIKDEQGDIYFVSSKKNKDESNMILRIKNGTTEIDSNYIGYSHMRNEPYGLWYLQNGKAIVQIANLEQYDTGADNYVEYFIMNLASGKLTKLDIPADNSIYTNNVAVDIKNGKVYLMTNREIDGDNSIYVYHIANDSIAKGLTVISQYKYRLRLDIMK